MYGLLKLIDQGLDNDEFSLSNIVAPPTFREFGLRTVSEVIAQYGEPADISLLPHQSLLIKPTRTWELGMDDHDLYEMTRGWWKINLDRAASIRYVFSIPKFIIRAVYEVEPGGWRLRAKGDRDWQSDLGKKPRVGFSGINVSAKFPHLIHKSVEHAYAPGQARRADCKYLDDETVRSLRRKGEEPWWNATT